MNKIKQSIEQGTHEGVAALYLEAEGEEEEIILLVYLRL